MPMFNNPTPPATLGVPSIASDSRKLKKIECHGPFNTSPLSKITLKMLFNVGLEVAIIEEDDEEDAGYEVAAADDDDDELIGSVTFVITPESRSPVTLSRTSTRLPINVFESFSRRESGSARRKNGRVVNFKTNSSDRTAEENEESESVR